MIDELRHKYSDNKDVLKKLDSWISNLPDLLQSYEQDLHKKELDSIEQSTIENKFVADFLLQHPFLYVSFSNTIIDCTNINVITFDTVSKYVNEQLSKNYRSLSKHKVINHVFRDLRTFDFISGVNSLHLSPSESDSILASFPFLDQKTSLYFATALGDMILSKTPNSVFYLLDRSFKEYIDMIHSKIYYSIGRFPMKFTFKDSKRKNTKESTYIEIPGTATSFSNVDSFKLIVFATQSSILYGSADFVT